MVIIILGILSAVVVFAVRGVGDKGSSNAVATDARVVRTALEAYCAQKGEYPQAETTPVVRDAMQVLVDAKFLSDRSTLNKLETNVGTQGNCGGKHYKLTETPPGGGGGIGPGPDPNPDATCADGPEGWCTVIPPNKLRTSDPQFQAETVVQLPSGKVLVNEGSILELFDPLIGAWTPIPSAPVTNPFGFGVPYSMTPIFGNACDESCGDVLAFVPEYSPSNSRWQLLDPATATWSLPSSPGEYKNTYFASAVQIRETNCGLNCGKVLMSPDDGGVAHLYDPEANSFTPIGQAGDLPKINQWAPTMASLHDGRILITGSELMSPSGGQVRPWAKLFDPVAASFSDAATPAFSHSLKSNPAVVLPDGSVLEVQLFTRPSTAMAMELYRPTENDWVPVPTCGNEGGCFILATLADGTVVANGVSTSFSCALDRISCGSKKIFLFDPVRHIWRQTGSLNSGDTPGDGALITGDLLTCGLNCGKVLVAGGNSSSGLGSAELYTPPACTTTGGC